MFVLVGRSPGERNPSLAVGPFDTMIEADEFRALLERTTKGTYVLLALHTPKALDA
jgi:hypothetical protein